MFISDRFFFIIDRVQRLKDARTEAAKEIEELKEQKNAEFKAFEAEVIHKSIFFFIIYIKIFKTVFNFLKIFLLASWIFRSIFC